MAFSMNFPVLANPLPQASSTSFPPLSSAKTITLSTSPLSSSFLISRVSLHLDETLIQRGCSSAFTLRRKSPSAVPIVAAGNTKTEPLRIMISGAPASGKGTQCELITKKMVKERLFQPDSQDNGWLLDGYPRSSSQAKALEDFGIRPDLFILLDVPEEILVERVVGRRLDPVTGRIYHLKYSPPETEEIAARLTQRFDDTEEKVKLRLHTHHQNVEDVLSMYDDITIKIDGSAPKEDVFAEIDNALIGLLERKKATSASSVASV